MNEKHLQIELQHDFIHLLSYAFPLCILLSNQNLKGWYMENYINYFFLTDNDGQLDAGIFDALEYGEFNRINGGLFDTSFIGPEILKHLTNITDFLYDYIDNSRYCIIFLDEFNIQGTENYNKTHFAHEFLIYGYDKQQETFDVIFFKEKFFSTTTIKVNIIEQAFRNSLKYIYGRGITCSDKMFMSFKLKNTLGTYNFRVDIFKGKMLAYLNGSKDAEMMYYKGWSKTEKEESTFGINTSIGLMNYINYISQKKSKSNKEQYIDLTEMYKGAHLFHEHRVGIFKRLNYLIEQTNCSDKCKELVSSYENIIKSAQIVRLKLLKLQTDFEKHNEPDWEKTDNILASVQSNLKLLYKCEKEILSEVVFLIPS